MKKNRSILSRILILTLVLSLFALGGGARAAAAVPERVMEASGTDRAGYAAVYEYVCVRLEGAFAVSSLGVQVDPVYLEAKYVDLTDMAGETVTLNDDGTGALYWGEDNKGPIDEWTMDGETIRFKAGVSTIEGTIVEGLMTLDLDEGMSVLFAAPGADVSAIHPRSLDRYGDYLKKAMAENGIPARM